MGNGDTNLYIKELPKDLLAVIFRSLLQQPGHHFPEWIGLQFFSSMGQQFVGDPWRAQTQEISDLN